MSRTEKFLIILVFIMSVLAFVDLTTEIGTRFWQQSTGHAELYSIVEDSKLGYINARGRVEIQPQFTDAQTLVKGDLIAVKDAEQGWGYIDRNGKWKILPRYVWARPFNEGYAAVAVDNGISFSYGFIDESGFMVIEPTYNSIKDFNDGLAAVLIGSKWGFINDQNIMIIRPEYQAVKHFSQNRVSVKKNGRWGIISNLSEKIVPFIFDDIGIYNHSLVPVRKGSKWGYLNLDGDEELSFKYNYASSFAEGLAVVRDENGWRYIDVAGKTVIDNKLIVEARPFKSGYAAVKMLPNNSAEVEEATWGFIDKTGRIIIEPLYEIALDFNGYLATVGLNKNETYRGYINASNEFIWKPLNLDVVVKERPNYGLYLLIFGLLLYGLGLMRLFLAGKDVVSEMNRISLPDDILEESHIRADLEEVHLENPPGYRMEDADYSTITAGDKKSNFKITTADDDTLKKDEKEPYDGPTQFANPKRKNLIDRIFGD